MKNYLYAVLISSTLFANYTIAQLSDGYQLTYYQPEYAFAPAGFDTNDNAQIILYGKFNDVCHKVAPPNYRIDEANRRIYIENRAYSANYCIEIYVNLPFTTTINLGNIPKGEYEIFVTKSNGLYEKMSTLPVSPARNPQIVDDFFYAEIGEIQFIETADPSAPQLTLKGALHSNCFSIREVKVSLSTSGNVYDVLPILDAAPGDCKPTHTPFNRTVTLNRFPNTPTLLNVRSSGGQAIQKVIDRRRFFQP